MFLASLSDFLGRHGALTVVGGAGDGYRAVEGVAEHRPDLVIMDVSMPRMNGLEAAAEIRRLAPAVRIILVSIHQDAQTQAESLQHGADGFVPKIGIQRRLLPEIERHFPQLKPGAWTP
jgi:DNA-binding NarL/FixJ family response regulator